MNETVLVDTGFWIALFDPREEDVGDKEDLLRVTDCDSSLAYGV